MQARMLAVGEQGPDIRTRKVYKVPSFYKCDLFQTASIPRIEDVKPNPIPLCVWVCDLAISY